MRQFCEVYPQYVFLSTAGSFPKWQLTFHIFPINTSKLLTLQLTIFVYSFSFYTWSGGEELPIHFTHTWAPAQEKACHLKQVTSTKTEGEFSHNNCDSSPLLSCNSEEQVMDKFFKMILTVILRDHQTLSCCKIILCYLPPFSNKRKLICSLISPHILMWQCQGHGQNLGSLSLCFCVVLRKSPYVTKPCSCTWTAVTIIPALMCQSYLKVL